MSACYRLKDTNNINDISNIDSPCAAPSSDSSLFVPCCTNKDQCLQYGRAVICHYTHTLSGGSGYYAGGCTDPTFKDSSCNRQCVGLADQEIVYNNTDSLWRCCGSTNGTAYPIPTCQTPTNETFQAAAPDALEAYSMVASTGVPVITVSTSTGASAATALGSTDTPVPSSIFPSSQNAPASTNLSAGALAGVIVGSIIGGGLLLALFVFGLWRVRKRRRSLGVDQPATTERNAKREGRDFKPVKEPQEVDSRHLRSELDHEMAKHELPAE